METDMVSKKRKAEEDDDDDSGQASTKRKPTDSPEDEHEFKIIFPVPKNLRTAIDVMSHAVPQCQFEISKQDDFEGITIFNADSDQVSVVVARIECEVTVFSGDLPFEDANSFFLQLSTLQILLKQLPDANVVELSRNLQNRSYILFKTYECSRFVEKALLRTQYNESPNQCSIPNLTYDTVVEIELEILRHKLQLCEQLGSQTVRFTVYQSFAPDKTSMHTLFTIAANCDTADILVMFYNTNACSPQETSGSDGREAKPENLVIHASTSLGSAMSETFPLPETMTVTYNHSFYVKSILKYVRQMEKSKSLRMYMSSDQALLIDYSLGSDNSNIRILLAPNLQEEEEEAQ